MNTTIKGALHNEYWSQGITLIRKSFCICVLCGHKFYSDLHGDNVSFSPVEGFPYEEILLMAQWRYVLITCPYCDCIMAKNDDLGISTCGTILVYPKLGKFKKIIYKIKKFFYFNAQKKGF